MVQQEVAVSFRCKKGLCLFFLSNKHLASGIVGINYFFTAFILAVILFSGNCNYNLFGKAPGFCLFVANQVKTCLKPRDS